MDPKRRRKKSTGGRGSSEKGTPDVKSYESLVAALRPLLKRAQVLEAQSVALGGAPSRELLACPRCGLREDVMLGGAFFTTREPIGGTTDTGLRFDKLIDGRYLCPACGAKVVEPEPPPLPPLFPAAPRRRGRKK